MLQLRDLHLGVRQAESLQYEIPDVLGFNQLLVQEDSLNSLTESLRIIGTDKGETAVSTVRSAIASEDNITEILLALDFREI